MVSTSWNVLKVGKSEIILKKKRNKKNEENGVYSFIWMLSVSVSVCNVYCA